MNKKLNYCRKKRGGVEEKECLGKMINGVQRRKEEGLLWGWSVSKGQGTKEVVSHVLSSTLSGSREELSNSCKQGNWSKICILETLFSQVENGSKGDKTGSKGFM